jgi:hypothetical protein
LNRPVPFHSLGFNSAPRFPIFLPVERSRHIGADTRKYFSVIPH